MHKSRQEASTKLPIQRKGSKYIVTTASHFNDSVSVLFALRDMLHLVKNKKEAKKVVHQKQVKLNGKLVEDYHESIKLFNVFEADKTYVLKLSPTKKFFFEESSGKSERLCKVINRTLVSNNKIQINLHDGSNFITDKPIKVGDSVYLDFSGKMKKHIAFAKGEEAFIIAGKYAGLSGKVEAVKENKAIVKLEDKKGSAELPISEVVVI